MRIIFCNARSVLSKIDQIKILLFDEKPHIFCITETWLNKDISSSILNVENYYIDDDFRIDRTDTLHGRGGGLLIYARNDIVLKKVENCSSFNQFCQFQLLMQHGNNPLNVTLIYRSPNSSAENNDKLAKLVEKCDKNSLIIGDFNYPGLDFANGLFDHKSRSLFDVVHDRFLCNIVTFPTHIHGNILDLAICDFETESKVLDISNIGNLGNSDHALIKIELDIAPKFNVSNQLVPNWRRGDTEGLKKHLHDTDFVSLISTKNANDAWQTFKSTIMETIDMFIPVTKRRKQGEPPWMTKKVKNLVNRKQRAWKNFSKNRTDALFEKYKRAEKECKKGVSAAKCRLERTIASCNNKRPFVAYVKSKVKTRSNIGPLKVGGEVISDNKGMANVLNDFFSSVFTVEPAGPVPAAAQLPSGSSLTTIQFSLGSVKKKLAALKNGASGPDGISPKFLKEYADELAPALTMIFNKSMEEGLVPEDWRVANVTPIFKKGAKGDPGNYRPVSLTSVPCRVMEACLKDNIVDHLSRNKLIKDSQHGFMKRKSCTTNLLHFLEVMTTAHEHQKPMDVVYLDFAKAFDKVPHRWFVEKLKAQSLGGQVLSLIKSWLADRKQRVVLNGQASDWERVHSGVPQGSVLGPLAFVVFINDLDEETSGITITNKFADDTKCGQVIESTSDNLDLQNALDNLVNWADKWGMAYNIKKCKVMHIGANNDKVKYKMQGTELEVADREKDIGVKVANTLKPSNQCQEAAGRANSVLGQITRAFHYRDRKTFLSLYIQYVRPHLEFAVPAWSPWSIADIQTLEKVQQKVVRMISGLQGKTYEDKLVELGLLSLQNRRLQYDLTQTFRIIRGFDDVKSEIWFTLVGENPARITRHTSDPLNIVKVTSKSEIRRNFFSQRVVEHWNQLPAETKRAKSVAAFKNKISELLGSSP